MLYLIDDNQRNQQQDLFKANYLFDGSFDDILVKLYGIKLQETNIIKEKLKEANAIFLHNTFEDQDDLGNYIKGGLRIRKMIENDVALEYNIPLVLFSYGMTDTIYDFDNNANQINSIRKDTFYENLYPFLKNYRESGQIDFRIIAYGVNFNVKLATKISEAILNKLSNTNDFHLSEIDINELKKYYELTSSQMDFNAFLDNIEDTVLSTQDFKNLITNINKSLFRYGRNIHH